MLDSINAKITPQAKHSWDSMLDSINAYIKSSNWGNKTELKSKKVKYYNKFATFKDDHTLILTDKKGQTEEVVFEELVLEGSHVWKIAKIVLLCCLTITV